MKYESYEYLLEDIKKNGINTESYTLLQIQDWFISSFKFDPVSNEPIGTNFDSLLRRIPELNKYSTILWPNDRLQNIIDFSSSAIYSLMDELHEKNIREHLIANIQHVRETDSNSIRYLSKKPGRTIKQKIASDQKLLGVFHNTTLDNSENRLFKAFIKRLDELLYNKEEVFGYDLLDDEQKDFNDRIHRWLSSEEAELIGHWGNLPPNNTLLNDRNYRKIWKSWNQLQVLDELVENDSITFKEKFETIFFWELIKKLNKSTDIQLVQQPIKFNYESFEIIPELNPIYGFIKNTNNYQSLQLNIKKGILVNDSIIPFEIDNLKIFENINSTIETICSKYFSKLHYKEESNNKLEENPIAAIDLSSSKPFYSTPNESGRVPFYLINQIWKNDTTICIPGFYSKLLRNDGIDNYSLKTFYADEENINTDIVIATADVFAEKISSYLNTMKCIYIVPDNFDDFSPVQRSLRNSINSHFIEASPIPKSIAAVFAETKKRKISPGTEIHVIDKYDDYWIFTKIIAVLDKELLEKNPISDGVVFERYPAIIISEEGVETSFNGTEKFIPKLFSKKECELLKDKLSINNYHFSNSTIQNFDVPDLLIELNKLEKERSEKNIITIEIKENITSGALILEDLQNQTPDIPLWKDHLPSLYIKVSRDGIEDDVVLVDRKHGAVQPKRGVSVPITIPVKDFILPAGKPYYEFPLVQGDNKNRKQSYFALLESDRFPLKEDIPCELHLTYTYGNEYPYELKFNSVYSNAEIKSVTVQWKNNSKKNWKDELPVPGFTEELSWEDMTRFDSKTGITNLLTEFVIPEIDKIDNLNNYFHAHWYRVLNVIRNPKNKDEDIAFIDFVCPNGRNACCYIEHSRGIKRDDLLFCMVNPSKNGFYKATEVKDTKKKRYWQITKKMKFAILTLWNNGHSLQDSELESNDFRIKMQKAIDYSVKSAFFDDEIDNNSQNLLKEFLCMLHKDMPEEMINDLKEYYETFPTRCIGNAIGDCSLEWQKDLFYRVINDSNRGKSIGILSKCLWRSKNLVFLLSKNDVKDIISYLANLLSNFNINKELSAVNLASDLETLLSLLRLRNDMNGKQNPDEEMLKLLSIQQNPDLNTIFKSLQRINKMVIEQNFDVYSRLSFDIDKSIKNKSPDLLFAAMTYVSGNRESKSIRVRSLVDEE